MKLHERHRVPELMDRTDADPVELARSLRDLERVNLWLRGGAIAVGLVWRIAERVPDRPVRVLDVGTGAADVPIALARKATAGGVPMRITATDLHRQTLAYARKAVAGIPAIEILRADALALPFADDACDIAICATMLHHLDEADAARTIAELDRVARWGIVVSDLARSWPAYVGARLLAATIWRNHPITRHDGPASIRAAFTPAELAVIASGVLRDGFSVRRHTPFRLSLVVDRTVEPGSGGKGSWSAHASSARQRA